jgi:predicted tellurium resistance membrane protein TerC
MQAILQITLADLSMSLDNVLAVAGAAHGHLGIMVGGLALSVLLMGVAAGILARLLSRYRWIAWLGLAVVAFVAMRMIWQGGWQIVPLATQAW